MRNSAFTVLKKKRFNYRFFGWGFFILGSVMSISFAQVMLDPNGVITYDGVETTSFAIKRNAFLYTAASPVIGLYFAFVSRRTLTRLLIWQARAYRFCFRSKGNH